MAYDEGVVKFVARHRDAPAPRHRELRALIAWRDVLKALDLVGQHDDRYGGAGFGNLSARDRRGFLITGTQTGHLPTLAPEHFARVDAFDLEENAVDSRGPARPSSESMTHGAIYAADPTARAVVHAHSPDVWALRLPRTRRDVPYGTPAMAREVARLAPRWRKAGGFAMGGHEDGVMTVGASVEQAGLRMVALLARAREA